MPLTLILILTQKKDNQIPQSREQIAKLHEFLSSGEVCKVFILEKLDKQKPRIGEKITKQSSVAAVT